jgi:hypothetical protein
MPSAQGAAAAPHYRHDSTTQDQPAYRQEVGTWQLFPQRNELLPASTEGDSHAGCMAGVYKLPAAADPFTHRNIANAPCLLLLLRVIK